MEKFSRTIKRIAALAGGAVMVGAALSGALAQLDKLPTPFVTSAGVFDSYVVVGTLGWNPNVAFNAAAASNLAGDIAVGIDVGAAFAQRATTGAGGSTVSGGVQVKAAGDDFNYYENAGVLKPNYGSEQLSVMADGDYKDTKGTTKNDVTYTQKVVLDPAFGLAMFDKDKTASNEVLGSYIKVAKGSNAYTYTLKFDSAVSWLDTNAATTMDDWKGTKLTIQGKTYTVSETTGIAPDSITLLAGSQEVTQAYQTEQTYTVGSQTFDVKVNAIAQEGPNADSYVTTLTINGQSFTALKEGDTVDVDGTTIGINSITYDVVVPTNSQVSFFLGADKIKLVDAGGTVKINDKEITGYSVTSDFDNANPGDIKGISVTVKPKDDKFLHIGDNWADPVFGQWQLMYTGMEKTTEDITADVSGQDGTIKMTTLDGKAVTIPVINDDSGSGVTYLGDNLDFVDGSHTNGEVTNDGLSYGNAMILNDTGICHDDTDLSNCEGVKFFAISSGGEMRVFELERYDPTTTPHQVDVKDLSTGKVYEKLDANGSPQDIGLIADFSITDSAPDLVFNHVNDYYANPTGWGGTIEFKSHKNADCGIYASPSSGSDDQIEFVIQDAHSGGYINQNYFSFGADTSSGDLQLTDSDSNLVWIPTVKDSKIKQAIDDNNADVTDSAHWGVVHTYDTDGKDSYKIEYPEEQVIFDAWMAPVGSAASGASTGAVNVNYINAATGIARTDADFASAVPTKNVILVGGPAVNELVSDLATANKTALATAYVTDTAIIQYVTDAFGTNDALVIAGYAAKDTKLAGQVVAANLLQGQFSDKMSGAKVTINTAGATTVSGVTFA